jgi:hypothetical protein
MNPEQLAAIRRAWEYGDDDGFVNLVREHAASLIAAAERDADWHEQMAKLLADQAAVEREFGPSPTIYNPTQVPQPWGDWRPLPEPPEDPS